MTFQDFLEKYNGKGTDWDGFYGFQCMDLMHAYIYEVLGHTDKKILAAPSAKQVYLSFPNIAGSQFFEKIDNIPSGVPKEGDIVFFGNGQYGHVAIFIEGNDKSFRSFDQNFPVGSLPHVQNHTYANCLGWLRCKQINDIPESLIKCQTDLADERKKKQENWEWGNELSNELDGAKAQIVTFENNLKAIATTLNCEIEMPKILGQITTLISKEDQLNKAIKEVQDSEARWKASEESLAATQKTLNDELLAKQAREKALQEVSQILEEERSKVQELLKSQKYEKIIDIGIWNLVLCKEVIKNG